MTRSRAAGRLAERVDYCESTTMDEDLHPNRKRRETILTVALVIILSGLFIFFMNLISLGIFMHVAAALVALALVGFLHYVLWGHALSEQTAGEREEAELRAKMDAEKDEWDRE